MSDHHPLTDADLLAWAVVLEYRRRQTQEGLKVLLLDFPPCPACGEQVGEAKTWWIQDPIRYDGFISMEPCGHRHAATAADLERIHDHATEMLDRLRWDGQLPDGKAWCAADVVREARARVGGPGEAATEATELDRTRRYLRPVQATIISDDPDGVHLAVYEWLPTFEAWATGPGLCGESMRQGPLTEGTAVTCPACRKWQPKYERMLAPGYRPEDDDPDVQRERAKAAEARVRELEAKLIQMKGEEDAGLLTVQEARDLVDRLGTDLYWAQDALAFVGECAGLVERKQGVEEGAAQVTTGDVRGWLKGPQCTRVAAVDGSLVPARGVDEVEWLREALRKEVRSAITASGRSQASIAREVTVSQKHLSMMLTGSAGLTLEWAARILRACGRRLVIGEASS